MLTKNAPDFYFASRSYKIKFPKVKTKVLSHKIEFLKKKKQMKILKKNLDFLIQFYYNNNQIIKKKKQIKSMEICSKYKKLK